MRQRIRNLRINSFLMMIVSIVTIGLCVFSFKIYKNTSEALCFSSSNIEDSYGRLDRNTQEIITKSLNKAMNEKHVPFHFALVYEDLNITYTESFEENAIIVYFNKSTNMLNAISKQFEGGFETPIIQEEIGSHFEEYISSISGSIKKDNDIKYYDSEKSKNTFKYLSLAIFVALCIISLLISIYSFGKIRRNNMLIRRTIREDRIRRRQRKEAAHKVTYEI